MKRKRAIRGKRLEMLTDIIRLHNELAELTQALYEHRASMEDLREIRKQTREERDTLIREAVKNNISMSEIGRRIGISKVGVYWISKEKDE